MQSDILSLADYIHAFQVVLQRLPLAQTDPRIAHVCAEANLILQRVEAAHLQRGIGSFEQAEFERISGFRLPSRVVLWLGECSRRMAAGEFKALARQMLHLCRALEWLLLVPEQVTVPTHLQITDLDRPAATGSAPTGSFRGRVRPSGFLGARH